MPAPVLPGSGVASAKDEDEDEEMRRALEASLQEPQAGCGASGGISAIRFDAGNTAKQEERPAVVRKCALCIVAGGPCSYHVRRKKSSAAKAHDDSTTAGSSGSGGSFESSSSKNGKNIPANAPICDLCKANGGPCVYHARRGRRRIVGAATSKGDDVGDASHASGNTGSASGANGSSSVGGGSGNAPNGNLSGTASASKCALGDNSAGSCCDDTIHGNGKSAVPMGNTGTGGVNTSAGIERTSERVEEKDAHSKEATTAKPPPGAMKVKRATGTAVVDNGAAPETKVSTAPAGTERASSGKTSSTHVAAPTKSTKKRAAKDPQKLRQVALQALDAAMALVDAAGLEDAILMASEAGLEDEELLPAFEALEALGLPT